jgi:uncharacterized membrane protein YfcA
MKTAREVAFLLLVLQAAIGFLTSLGPIVLSLGGAPANAILAVLAIALSIIQVVLAALFLRGSRRAGAWLIAYEALCLSGAALAAWIHLGADDRFAPVATNLALPTLLLVLLLRLRLWSAHEDRSDRRGEHRQDTGWILGGGRARGALWHAGGGGQHIRGRELLGGDAAGGAGRRGVGGA